MLSLLTRALVLLWCGLVWSGCAGVKRTHEREPAELLNEICSIGGGLTSVSGSLWLKADSKEAKGQFPASVKMENPDQLLMEVTNMVGGVEALIEVSGEQYVVKSSQNGLQPEQRGQGTWGGIPLAWAPSLVLGRIPCPRADLRASASYAFPREDELKVEIRSTLAGDAQEFRYFLRTFRGRLWPVEVRWARRGAFGAEVRFEFEDPEDGTLIPRRWTASSTRGSVKVRWKSRVVH